MPDLDKGALDRWLTTDPRDQAYADPDDTLCPLLVENPDEPGTFEDCPDLTTCGVCIERLCTTHDEDIDNCPNRGGAVHHDCHAQACAEPECWADPDADRGDPDR